MREFARGPARSHCLAIGLALSWAPFHPMSGQPALKSNELLARLHSFRLPTPFACRQIASECRQNIKTVRHPSDAEPFYRALACAKWLLRELDDAVAHARTAVRIERGAAGLSLLSACLIDAGHSEEAMVICREALALEQPASDKRMLEANLAEAMFNRGEVEAGQALTLDVISRLADDAIDLELIQMANQAALASLNMVAFKLYARACSAHLKRDVSAEELLEAAVLPEEDEVLQHRSGIQAVVRRYRSLPQRQRQLLLLEIPSSKRPRATDQELNGILEEGRAARERAMRETIPGHA